MAPSRFRSSLALTTLLSLFSSVASQSCSSFGPDSTCSLGSNAICTGVECVYTLCNEEASGLVAFVAGQLFESSPLLYICNTTLSLLDDVSINVAGLEIDLKRDVVVDIGVDVAVGADVTVGPYVDADAQAKRAPAPSKRVVVNKDARLVRDAAHVGPYAADLAQKRQPSPSPMMPPVRVALAGPSASARRRDAPKVQADVHVGPYAADVVVDKREPEADPASPAPAVARAPAPSGRRRDAHVGPYAEAEKRDPLPSKRAPVPSKRVPQPSRRVATPEPVADAHVGPYADAEKRDPLPSKRAPVPSKRAPAPSKRVPQPSKRVPQPSPRVAKPEPVADAHVGPYADSEKRAPLPSKRDPAPSKRAPAPSKRVPQPSKRVPEPSRRVAKPEPVADAHVGPYADGAEKRDPLPSKRAPVPSKRAPQPSKRVPQPSKRAPQPSRRAANPAPAADAHLGPYADGAAKRMPLPSARSPLSPHVEARIPQPSPSMRRREAKADSTVPQSA